MSVPFRILNQLKEFHKNGMNAMRLEATTTLLFLISQRTVELFCHYYAENCP